MTVEKIITLNGAGKPFVLFLGPALLLTHNHLLIRALKKFGKIECEIGRMSHSNLRI